MTTLERPRQFRRGVVAPRLGAELLVALAVCASAREVSILGPRDVLQIGVHLQPDLTREVRIDDDGRITLPLIGRRSRGRLHGREPDEGAHSELPRVPQRPATFDHREGVPQARGRSLDARRGGPARPLHLGGRLHDPRGALLCRRSEKREREPGGRHAPLHAGCCRSGGVRRRRHGRTLLPRGDERPERRVARGRHGERAPRRHVLRFGLAGPPRLFQAREGRPDHGHQGHQPGRRLHREGLEEPHPHHPGSERGQDRNRGRLDTPLQAKDTVVVLENVEIEVVVLGEVARPGRYKFPERSTIIEVLSQVGGLSADSGDRVLATRPSSAGQKEPQAIVVPTEKLFSPEGPADLDIELRNGDTVNVPRAEQYFIFGEVVRPGAYKLQKGATITVLKAIILAGGFTNKASKKAGPRSRARRGPRRRTSRPNSTRLCFRRTSLLCPRASSDRVLAPDGGDSRGEGRVRRGCPAPRNPLISCSTAPGSSSTSA